MNRFRLFLLIAVIFVFIVILTSLIHNPSNIGVSAGRLDKAYFDIQQEGIRYSNCILAQIGEGKENQEIFRQNLGPAVESCVNQTRFGELPVVAYPNRDEIKYYLHEADSKPSTKSVVLTLGVGKDVRVEEALKKVLSNESEFFGADPMLENDALFSPLGYFFPLAVGKTTGMTNASVLTERRYKSITMMHIDIMTFMRNIVRRNIIDIFLMDNEGPEYDIQPMMARGREFDKAGITVCQINGEFHGGHLEQLHSVLLDVFHDIRFIPIKIVSGFHVRIFMINIDSKYCIERYLVDHFSQL